MTVRSRPDTRDMVLVHRVFRRELRLLPALVRAVPDRDLARAGRVRAHADEVLTMLHHHHQGEDDLLWPRLLERAAPQEALVRRMEAQHDDVARDLTAVLPLLAAWTEAPDSTTAQPLAAALDRLTDALCRHLDEEERSVLPLVEQHVTVREWAELGRHGMASTPRSRRMAALGQILEDASDAERRHFLAHLPPPVRLVWRAVGQRNHRREVAALRAGLPVGP